ncbi:hypothetical protein D3C76_1226800 [compost metagenome]
MAHRRLQLHRPHRLVHQGVAQLADLLLELVAVVGGDHHRRQGLGAAGIDPRHGVDAIAVVVQVVVGDQQVGLGMVVVHLARQVLLRQRGDHPATPPLQQGAHAGANRRIVIQHPHPRPAQAFEHRLADRQARLGLWRGGAQRHFDREYRAFAKP